MNIEIISPKRQQNPETTSEVSPDTYIPSTQAVNQNPSLSANFMIICPSPELNLFDTKQVINNRSVSNQSSRELNTGETIFNYDNDLDSFHSFELWNFDTKPDRPMSLPKERIDTNSDIDMKTGKSLENNLILKLKSLVIDDMVSQAEALNHKIENKLSVPLPETRINTAVEFPGDTEIVEKNSIVCCNCKKSKCLRLHCVCFAELRECGELCKCFNCKNNSEFKDMRNFVIEKTKEINPLAFKPKIKNYMGMNVNSRGCNCSKNNCLKRYCECYKSGSGCTKLCTCAECKNTKDFFSKDDIIDIKDKGYRRKHKIVINEPSLDKRGFINDTEGVVCFVKHKKKRKSKTKL